MFFVEGMIKLVYMQKYQFKKPEIASVWEATWNTIKIRWQFWSILAVALIPGMALVIFGGSEGFWDDLRTIFVPYFLIIIVYIGTAGNKISVFYWKQFAKLNGWQYKGVGEPKRELGVMFQKGAGRKIDHLIEGDIEGRHFRIFNYDFSTGSGKSRTNHNYVVFVFKFNGSFPHIYLNNKHNYQSLEDYFDIGEGEKVPLPGEFEKNFSLSAPRKYETEALEIFTPDIMAKLLDNGFSHDVEFVDQEMLIFVSGSLGDAEDLEKEFNKALELEDLLDEKLDKFKFEKIGDMPPTLS